MRILILFSFIWLMSGCLPALASDCGKLCSSSWWKTTSISDLKLELSKDNNINGQNSWGWTPLHHAAKIGKKEYIILLLKHKADVDAQCKNGNTPLHVAALNASSSSVTTLLDAGSNIKLKNDSGKTAYLIAKQNKKIINTDAFKRLKQ